MIVVRQPVKVNGLADGDAGIARLRLRCVTDQSSAPHLPDPPAFEHDPDGIQPHCRYQGSSVAGMPKAAT